MFFQIRSNIVNGSYLLYCFGVCVICSMLCSCMRQCDSMRQSIFRIRWHDRIASFCDLMGSFVLDFYSDKATYNYYIYEININSWVSRVSKVYIVVVIYYISGINFFYLFFYYNIVCSFVCVGCNVALSHDI